MVSRKIKDETLLSRFHNALIAFAAGAIGMLAQLIWVRVLIQWFGTSAVTIASALAASLAGLAIGAFIFRDPNLGLAKWLGSPPRRPGWLLLIAGIGVLEGWTLLWFADRFQCLTQASPSPTVALLVTATLTLVPLNIALGGILPTLIESARTFSTRTVGVLYGAETLGGAAGALVAGFWLIQQFGLSTTLLAAGLFGILLGATALFRTSDLAVEPADEDHTEAAPLALSDANTEPLNGRTRMVTAIFLAGVASLSMEIIWQRALILLVGTDTHSYMIVAVSYLIGVSIGSFLCGQFTSQKRANLFGWLQLGVGLTSLLAFAMFCKIASGEGQQWLNETSSTSEVISKRFLASFALLILPSCLTGASFPAAVSMLTRSKRVNALATGQVYAIIAAGNIAGVLLTGFLLVPITGLQASLIILSLLAIAAAAMANRRWNFVFTLVAACVIATGGYLAATRQPLGLSQLPPTQHLIFYQEGPVNTVSVIVDDDASVGHQVARRMAVDGIVIGENVGGVDEKQRVLAHLPLLIHAMSGPETAEKLNAISIGLGTGILAGEMVVQPSIQHVTCVELSPAVINASAYFSDDNHELESNPHATIVQGDGIYFLRQAGDAYDCIVSDGKSRPGHAGNVAFFSSDYYRLASQRLAGSGSFVQWVSLDGSVAEIQTILKTFAAEFEHAYIAIAAPDSVYLIGRKKAIPWSKTAANDYLKNAVSLHPYGWRTSDDIRSMAWLDAHKVAAALPADLMVNSLNQPSLERFALDIHRPEAQYDKMHNLAYLESCLNDPAIPLFGFSNGLSKPVPGLRDACLNLVRAAKILADPIDVDLSKAAVHQREALKTLPNSSRGIGLADRILAQVARLGPSLSTDEVATPLVQAAMLAPTDAELQMLIGTTLADRKQFDRAAGCFYRTGRLLPNDPEPQVAFARCLIELKKYRAAVRPLQAALRLQPDHEEAKQLLRFTSEVLGSR